MVGGLRAGYQQLLAKGKQQWDWNPPPTQQPSAAGPSSTTRHEAAVVVFGNGAKKALKVLIQKLSPTAAAALEGVQQVMTGAARCLLLSKASNVELIQTLVPLLQANGCRAATI